MDDWARDPTVVCKKRETNVSIGFNEVVNGCKGKPSTGKFEDVELDVIGRSGYETGWVGY